MTDLPHRLENARPEDVREARELDREIKELVGAPWDYLADWGTRGNEQPVALPYTSSVDAALLLVPPDWLVEKQGEWPFPDDPSRPFYAILRPRAYGALQRAQAIDAASPALAIAAAAVRARGG